MGLGHCSYSRWLMIQARLHGSKVFLMVIIVHLTCAVIAVNSVCTPFNSYTKRNF